MPITKQQSTNIIGIIESELKFLKDFFEAEENKSISLLDLINLGKSNELINNTSNLQKIFLKDEDLKIQEAILDLFEEAKNNVLKKQLSDIKDKLEKTNQDQKQINSLINTYKKKQDIAGQIKYICLRILFRKISIANLAKLKLLTDIIGENETSGYIEILQNKFSEQGKPGQIAFIHLNNIFDEDTEKELRDLGNKKPIKRPPTQARQSEQAIIVESTTASSSHLDSLSDLSSSSEKISTSTPTQSLDSKSVVRPPKDKNSEKIVELPSEFLPSWEIFAQQQEHIDALEKAFEFIKKDYDILHIEKTELQEEVTKLQNIKERLETEKSRAETRYKVLEVKGITQSNKEKALTEQKGKSDRKLLETERVRNELQENTNELQSKYDAQNLSLETISSELESVKKLLQETQDNLSQKEIHLEEIDIQLKETEETANRLKNLQPDLNAANEKVNQLNVKQSSLETEIAAIQAENQKLNTELQANQVQKAKLENTLKNLGNTLQSNESENQKKLFEATETIQELKEEIETNSKSIEYKESEINTLKSELIEIQSKSEQLEKRNHLLENQAAQLTTESNIISDENATLHQNLTQAQEKIGALESEIHNHQNKLKGLSENTLADNQQISALKSQLDILNKSNEELNKEIAALKKSSDQADQTIINLKNEKENLEEALQLEQQKFSQAEDKKNNLQSKLDKLSKTDSSNQETLSEFATQLDDLTTLKSEQDALIQSLEKKLKEKDQEIDSLTLENQQRIGELKQLTEKLTDTQNTFNKLEHEIIDLKAEKAQLEEKDSENKSKISALENQIEKFDESYARDNESIEQLTAQITTYKNNIIDLEAIIQKTAEEPIDFESQFQQLEIAKKGLEDEKLDLDKRISALNQQNTELRGLLDQSADNDELIIELKRNKAQIEKQLMTAHNELKILNEKLKSNETADSNLKDNYATLEEKLSEKNSELHQITFELATVKQQLEEVREKTKEQGGSPMPEKELDLMSFEDQNLVSEESTNPFDSKVSFRRPDDSTSSGRASGESSSSPVFNDDKLVNPFDSSSDSLFNSDGSIEDPMDPFNLTGTLKSPKVPKIILPNAGTSTMPTQEEQDGDVLSEEEIQKIPSELQYADTIKDFVSGLRVKYSHLSSDYEGKIDDNNFKNLRLILRKKALVDTNQVIPKDNEIIDLDAKAWLEKKLQLITGKSVNLKLVQLEKEQKNLLNELSSSLHISTFYDIAITGKSIPDLIQEIEKVSKIQLSVAEQVSQIFQEIDTKQAAYPELKDDRELVDFVGDFNQPLEEQDKALPKINADQATILLMRINQELAKNKWAIAYNKTEKEIISNSLVNISQQEFFNFTKDESKELIVHAWKVLCKNPSDDLKKIKQWLKLTLEKREQALKDTMKKREHWLKDIALLHAITKKLALFSPKIKENIAKFEDLRVRKEEDINQLEEPVAKKIEDAVYLPHRHTIIANSLDPNVAKRLPADFELLDGAFYKQDPLQIGQTITFALNLHNGEEQKCSVTRNETCLAYKIHTPWLNIVNKIKDGVANKMTYARSNTNSSKQFNTEEETLFTLLMHAVNSSKGPTHTIMLGKKCSNEKAIFIYSFAEKINADPNLSNKKTILVVDAKVHSDDKKTIYNKFHKANSHSVELGNAAIRISNTLNRNRSTGL